MKLVMFHPSFLGSVPCGSPSRELVVVVVVAIFYSFFYYNFIYLLINNIIIYLILFVATFIYIYIFLFVLRVTHDMYVKVLHVCHVI